MYIKQTYLLANICWFIFILPFIDEDIKLIYENALPNDIHLYSNIVEKTGISSLLERGSNSIKCYTLIISFEFNSNKIYLILICTVIY